MKRRTPSYQKATSVFLSAMLALGLAPIPAFAAASEPTPPHHS